MSEKKLPDNWRIEYECHGGTGHGDEMFGYALYRWGTYATGRLWWKKRQMGWLFKRWDWQWTKEEAIELAARTEQMLTREKGAAA